MLKKRNGIHYVSKWVIFGSFFIVMLIAGVLSLVQRKGVNLVKIFLMNKNTLLAFCLLLAGFSAFAGDKKVTQRDIQVYINDFKRFNTETITLVGDTLRTDYCLNAECNQFISWQFSLRDIQEMKVGQDDGSYFVQFICTEGECIKPPTIGTIYSHKHEYSLYTKGEKEAKQLLQMFTDYRK